MYKFIEIEQNKFRFTTKNNVGYDFEFSSLDFIFNQFYSIQNSAYEITLTLTEIPFGKLPSEDSEIAETIATIIRRFFSGNKNAFLIFHTADFDTKASVRNRKFTSWFYQFSERRPNGFSIEKYDKAILKADLTIHYVSLLVKAKNPSKNAILDAFDVVLGDEEEAK